MERMVPPTNGTGVLYMAAHTIDVRVSGLLCIGIINTNASEGPCAVNIDLPHDQHQSGELAHDVYSCGMIA